MEPNDKREISGDGEAKNIHDQAVGGEHMQCSDKTVLQVAPEISGVAKTTGTRIQNLKMRENKRIDVNTKWTGAETKLMIENQYF